MSQLTVWSFYCFVDIPAPEMLLPKLLLIAKKKQIKGTILLSKEGFNGSICANRQDADLLFCQIVNLTHAKNVNLKINDCSFAAFSRLKIKIKKEIVTMGVGDLDVAALKGRYVKPEKWDEFIAQEQVVLLDTRNDYEVAIGTFKNAINPDIKNFRDLPKWLEQNLPTLKDKKVAMFCTGGIRCEKSTAYLKALGHNQIYHLEGGILQYLADTKNQSAAWQGDCFVFDDRRQVDTELNDPRARTETKIEAEI
jgi:UPF0176 protein